MSNRLIPLLSISCSILIGVYLVLVATTIFFAAWETKLSASVRASESRIVALETEYYAAIDAINTTNLASAGYTRPKSVEYVNQTGSPTVTFAGTSAR